MSMNAHETLKKIKAFFSDQPLPEPVAPVAPVEPVQLEAKEYSLADGTKVMIDKLEIGGMVTINDAPAPMGEHILADGSKVKLDESGTIVEIEAAEPAAPAPADLSTPEQMQIALAAFADGVTNPDMQKMATILKAVFENVFGWQIREAQEKANRDAAIALYQSGFAEHKQLKEGMLQLVALVEALSETPAAEPLEPQKTKFGAVAEGRKERLEKITSVLTQIKNK